MDTFFWYGELAALCDLNVDLGLVTNLLHILDLLYDFVALENFAEHDVLAVEMAGDISVCQGNERKIAYPGVEVVMKNCEPLVSLPALAMERRPFFECFNLKFSSGNLAP